MLKNKISICILILLILIILSGCSGEEPAKEEMNEANKTNMEAFNFLGLFRGQSGISKKEPETVKPFKNLNSYGLGGNKLNKSVFVQGDTVLFESIKDMEIAFSNENLRKEYNEKFDIEFPKSFCVLQYCMDHLDQSFGALYFYGDDFFIIITTFYSGEKEGIILVCAAGQPDEPISIGMDGLEYQTEHYDGKEIYWLETYSGKYGGNCSAYTWREFGYVGDSLITGDHKQENLELCKLVQNEFYKE